MGWGSPDVIRFDLRPLLQDKTWVARLVTHLLLVLELLECETDPQEIIGWASFDVVRFDLGPLIQDQIRVAKLKSAIIPLNNLEFS